MIWKWNYFIRVKLIRKVIYLILLSSMKMVFLWAWLDCCLCILKQILSRYVAFNVSNTQDALWLSVKKFNFLHFQLYSTMLILLLFFHLFKWFSHFVCKNLTIWTYFISIRYTNTLCIDIKHMKGYVGILGDLYTHKEGTMAFTAWVKYMQSLG